MFTEPINSPDLRSKFSQHQIDLDVQTWRDRTQGLLTLEPLPVSAITTITQPTHNWRRCKENSQYFRQKRATLILTIRPQ